MNAWYNQLNRPPLTPPDWVFGPVWSVLYVMIAVALVWYVRATWVERPLRVWALITVHVASNVLWTPLFFVLRRPDWALIDILVLDATLIALILVFWRARRGASILLWPYMLWVSFATYLNIGFVVLNG